MILLFYYFYCTGTTPYLHFKTAVAFINTYVHFIWTPFGAHFRNILDRHNKVLNLSQLLNYKSIILSLTIQKSNCVGLRVPLER